MEYFDINYNVQTGETITTPWTSEQIAEAHANQVQNNKQQAKNLLADTDWTTIADVSDPTKANPYLANAQAFIDYRNALRAIVFNPTYDAVFPDLPIEDWQSNK
jgi:hypothetical protein